MVTARYRSLLLVPTFSMNGFSMDFGSKFKINLYHDHFPKVLEKHTYFPKFTLLFSISYVRINRDDICR